MSIHRTTCVETDIDYYDVLHSPYSIYVPEYNPIARMRKYSQISSVRWFLHEILPENYDTAAYSLIEIEKG
jgi:hypothetical protein